MSKAAVAHAALDRAHSWLMVHSAIERLVRLAIPGTLQVTPTGDVTDSYERTPRVVHRADHDRRFTVGLDTEHAPAARVVGPPELDVAGQGPGGHRSDLRGKVHPPPHPVGHHCATAVMTAPGSALLLTDGGSHRPGKSCSSGPTTSCVTCAHVEGTRSSATATTNRRTPPGVIAEDAERRAERLSHKGSPGRVPAMHLDGGLVGLGGDGGVHRAAASSSDWSSSGMALASVGRPRRAQWSGPPFDASIGRVLHSVRQLLVRWRLPADVIDDAVLVVAELLANVVEHARTPFRVVAELRVRMLYLAVEDGAVGRAPAGPGCASPGYLSGLRLVNAVALRWGWQQHQTGKTVWAEVLT